jgi:uncharacterized damage-inducible protein DinB
VTPQQLVTLTETRRRTIAVLEPLSQRQLDYSPSPGRWSVGEVAHHIILSESIYRDEIARLIALARAGNRPHLHRSFRDVNVAPLFLPTPLFTMMEIPMGIMSRFIPTAVRSFMTEYPLVPTRNPDIATPRHGMPADELRSALARGIDDTRTLIESNADLDYSKMISEHPLTGATAVPDILHFLVLHERRHQGQMERVRSDWRFPPS